MQQQRQYDLLYDPLFTVSGPQDHYREQGRVGGYSFERVPDFGNMFSELPTAPAHGFQVKMNKQVPTFVSQDPLGGPSQGAFAAAAGKGEASIRSRASNITGPNRYKYFSNAQNARQTGARYIFNNDAELAAEAAQKAEQERIAEIERQNKILTKTVETMTDYRDSEQQTDPYSPDFDPDSIEEGFEPEVWHLRDMKYGDLLPAHAETMELVHRGRDQREWEAKLPPLVGSTKAQLALRKRLMEEREIFLWGRREKDIRKLQEERLAALEKSLIERSENRQAAAAERLERLRQAELVQKQKNIAGIQKRRLMTLRKLAVERKGVEGILVRPSVVSKYADFASDVYAPPARSGLAPDRTKITTEFDPREFDPKNYSEFRAFEQRVETLGLMNPIATLKLTKKALHRTEREKMAHLDQCAQDISDRKEALGLTSGSSGFEAPLSSPTPGTANSKDKYKKRKIVRPPTPTILDDDPKGDAVHKAIMFIQRLIRGRARQNLMFEGKESRMALIEELRMAETGESEEEGLLIAMETRQAEEEYYARLEGAAVAELLAAFRIEDEDDAIAKLRELQVKMFGDMLEEQEQTEAALKIQAVQRGRLARRQAAEKKANFDPIEELLTDIKTFALGPGYVDPDEEMPSGPEAEAAATKIQAVQRGKMARAQLKQEREEQEAAAVKIQAVQRGKRARAEARAKRQAASGKKVVSGGLQVVDLSADDIATLSGPDAEAAALKIQSRFRGNNARAAAARMRDSKEREDLLAMVYTDAHNRAAIRIQANFRGHSVRKTGGRKSRSPAVRVEEPRPVGEEPSQELPEVSTAYDRRLAKRNENAKRKAVSLASEVLGASKLSFEISTDVEEAVNAARARTTLVSDRMKITASSVEDQMDVRTIHVDGHIADDNIALRGAAELSKAQQGRSKRLARAHTPTEAATIIQKNVRGFLARKRMQVQVDPSYWQHSVRYKSKYKGKILRREKKAVEESRDVGEDEEDVAVAKIQSIQRSRAAKQVVEEMARLGELSKEELVMLEALRGMPDGTEVEAQALTIQASARGRVARAEFARQRTRHGDTLLSRAVETTINVDPELEEAAIKIQKVQRGRAARKEMERLRVQGKLSKEEIREAEALYKLEGEEMEQAAILIQSRVRGRLARQEIEKLKSQGLLTAQEEKILEKDLIGKLEGAELEAAALKIQANVRGRQARKEVAAMRDAMT